MGLKVEGSNSDLQIITGCYEESYFQQHYQHWPVVEGVIKTRSITAAAFRDRRSFRTNGTWRTVMDCA